MNLKPIELIPDQTARIIAKERRVNRFMRRRDAILEKCHLGGRKGRYDDITFEFMGGTNDRLRKQHYDKSLRLLWKAEEQMPWSSFRDCTNNERMLLELADGSLKNSERGHLEKIKSDEFKALLNREYTPEQKQAIVNILSTIGHGEAYAWMVSTEVLSSGVEGTGARAALTMQVMEEAKHFVVLRELIKAFDCPVPRMSIWEYMVMERTLKSKGLEKFFGMNVLIEGFALNLFGLLSVLPGLEVLRLFHLDESRHTALPSNYFSEKPMTRRQSKGLLARIRRGLLLAPTLPLMTYFERDFAVLGLDIYDFAGSMFRKVVHLSERVGFELPIPGSKLLPLVNVMFNKRAKQTRKSYARKDYHLAETTQGVTELAIEAEVFELNQPAAIAS
ncbi:MAG: hypothetical protein QF890_02750 [Myxococcota bacterium]|nr:hypothetical protein [Deltaproteobacteria bacterium]MCP4239601.1 hypothetical protein [bacterium]MDP6075311.1 hypothetical protein [Myxococcota bacterium]MBT37880.1 hypothetical protein [Deltaproteobacteria bacterium]MDP7074013.1 hypothetical protein [Myxococcota bacterium]